MADIGIRSWSVRSNGNKMILKSICFSPESESIAKAEHAHDIRKYDMNVDVATIHGQLDPLNRCQTFFVLCGNLLTLYIVQVRVYQTRTQHK